jgi:hypothetical protein
MPTVHLRIEPVFCGPVSVGTVGLIKLVRERFGLSLTDAKSAVDRCVFDSETVVICTPTYDVALLFVQEVAALHSPARFHVELEPD